MNQNEQASPTPAAPLLFDAYELKEVSCINGEDCEPIETAEDREHAEETGAAIFWTIYGHYAPKSGREGVEALIDNTDEKAAREIYDHLTRALDALKARI